ncbi:MAG: reverse transcriptase family protein [Candidatus Thiodiazotropha sp.]
MKPNFRWDSQSEFIYKSALLSEDIVNQINSVLLANETVMDVDAMLSKVESILNSAAKLALKERKICTKSKTKKKKWFDRDCYALRREVLSLGRKLCRSTVTHEQRMLFFSKKKELRKMVKVKKRVFRQNILDQLNNLEENNPKQYWKLVAELKELESSSSNNSNCVSAQEWINHFSKLLYNKNMENCSELESFICKMSTVKSFTNLDYRITKDEIKICISRLKSGKAVGLDRISAEMVKASIGQLLPVYEQLFNTIFRKGVYPNNWKESFIVPIFKSGSRKDPSNYRGIAINSILGKVFSMILTNRLESFAKDNQLIGDTQIGFKKGCRTADHMFILTTLIDKYVKKLKSPLYVCFVDFKKAYDSIWRQALLYKLLMVNINGLFFNILKSMYTNNEMCVRVSNSHRSHFFTSNVGVRQGDAISPILFNLYVSDLQNYLSVDHHTPLLDTTYVNCLMYADDLVLVSRSEVGLQGLIDKLSDYCKRWKMDVNTEKTKILKFSGNGHKCKTSFFYREKLIEML